MRVARRRIAGLAVRRRAGVAARRRAGGAAGREPVLKQVDLPHSYYWRELYLPQLTTGPSSRELPARRRRARLQHGRARCGARRIGADEAVELTHARRRLRLPARRRAAMAAASCSRATTARRWNCGGSTWRAAARSALTHGRRGQRRAALVAGRPAHRVGVDRRHGALQPVRRRPRRRRACATRARCSATRAARSTATTTRRFDHAINPSWSPDGQLAAVRLAIAEVAWGTGDLWIVPVDAPRAAPQGPAEETSWSARARSSRRTASACCSPATTAGRRTSCG